MTLAILGTLTWRTASRQPLPAVSPPGQYFAFTTSYPPFYDIQGFRTLSRLEIFRPFDTERKAFSFSRPEGRYTLTWLRDIARVAIDRDGRRLIEIPVAPVVAQARAFLARHPAVAANALPQEALTLDAENGQVKVRLYFDDVSARDCGVRLCWYHFKADILLTPKDKA
jgi:hypothetical protein